MLNAAAPVLFPGLDSVFSAVRVGDFLFDGITIHCSEAEGTIAALVCSLLPAYAPPTIRPRRNSSDFEYSFLAHVRSAVHLIVKWQLIDCLQKYNEHRLNIMLRGRSRQTS